METDNKIPTCIVYNLNGLFQARVSKQKENYLIYVIRPGTVEFLNQIKEWKEQNPQIKNILWTIAHDSTISMFEKTVDEQTRRGNKLIRAYSCQSINRQPMNYQLNPDSLLGQSMDAVITRKDTMLARAGLTHSKLEGENYRYSEDKCIKQLATNSELAQKIRIGGNPDRIIFINSNATESEHFEHFYEKYINSKEEEENELVHKQFICYHPQKPFTIFEGGKLVRLCSQYQTCSQKEQKENIKAECHKMIEQQIKVYQEIQTAIQEAIVLPFKPSCINLNKEKTKEEIER